LNSDVPEARTTAGYDGDQVEAIFARTIPRGRLQRMPRNPEQRDLLLACCATGLDRRYPYSEVELNEVLRVFLERLDAAVDHVTCRRYLVDLDFVKRDRAGNRYYLNWPRLEATVAPAVLATLDELLDSALAARRSYMAQHRRP